MTVLFVFPHPDDETIFAGGTIAKHVSRGDKVIWLCASYGERGGASERRSSRLFYFFYILFGYFPFLISIQILVIWWLSIFRKPNLKLRKIRNDEAVSVSKIYGVNEPVFLEISDMRFSENKKMLTEKIRHLIEKHRPQKIYTLHPNGITGHPDHIALGDSVISAAKNTSLEKEFAVFGSAIPERITKKFHLPLIGVDKEKIAKEVTLTETELNIKIQAISAYKSQKYLWEIYLQKYPELLEKEYFVRLC